jgi:hypothetical protein
MKANHTFNEFFHVVLLALGQFATQRQATPINSNSTNAPNQALQRTATARHAGCSAAFARAASAPRLRGR